MSRGNEVHNTPIRMRLSLNCSLRLIRFRRLIRRAPLGYYPVGGFLISPLRDRVIPYEILGRGLVVKVSITTALNAYLVYVIPRKARPRVKVTLGRAGCRGFALPYLTGLIYPQLGGEPAVGAKQMPR